MAIVWWEPRFLLFRTLWSVSGRCLLHRPDTLSVALKKTLRSIDKCIKVAPVNPPLLAAVELDNGQLSAVDKGTNLPLAQADVGACLQQSQQPTTRYRPARRFFGPVRAPLLCSVVIHKCLHRRTGLAVLCSWASTHP